MIKFIMSILIGIVCGLLGSYSGAEGISKSIRRYVIPILLTGFVVGYLRNLFGLFLILLILPFIQGYGIPSWNDGGSSLGRFWYNLLKKYADFLSELETQKFASIFTRATVGFLVCLMTISIPIITGHWLTYIISSICIVLVYALLSWRTLGGFKFLKKYLTFSEFYTYLTIGIGVCITALF